MSAWDIAGAVVWTPLAFLMWCFLIDTGGATLPPDGWSLTICTVITIVLSLASVFCVARLCGAHA